MRPRQRLAMWLGGVMILAGGAFSLWRWQVEAAEVEERVEREQERAEEREEREEEVEEYIEDLARESDDLMPEILGGVKLGMERLEVRVERPNMRPHQRSTDPTLEFFMERLPQGSQVVYGFTKGSGRLVRVQVMSMLPNAEAFRAHLTAMIETYGRPTGPWHCPDTDGIPTMRFTWRRAHAGIADVFLIYGDRISVTLDIAPVQTIASSLARAGCGPMTQEQLQDFPTATVEQIEQAKQAQDLQDAIRGGGP